MCDSIDKTFAAVGIDLRAGAYTADLLYGSLRAQVG